MSAKDGGPAFPAGESFAIDERGRMDNRVMKPLHDGMSLRDYFAGQALVGYAANARVMDNAIDGWEDSGGPRPSCVAEYLAGLSYEVADAMIAAREESKPKRRSRRSSKAVQ